MNGKKHHIHRFLFLDDNLVLKSFTKPFIFKHYGIEMTGKMTLDSFQKKLVLPLMIENQESLLAILDLDRLGSLLEPLSSSEHYRAVVQRSLRFDSLKKELISAVDPQKLKKNPFVLSIPIKEEPTQNDFEDIQNLIKGIKIDPLLKELYPQNQGYTTFEDLQKRCTKALQQTLINSEKKLFPTKQLIKIGEGGERCIVTYCSLKDNYISSVKTIPDALKEIGFNGYLLSLTGGFPNPTGLEILYAGVPYSFKIFMLLEAYKLGFNQVLWIDSLAIPSQDLNPIFSKIEEKGAFITGWQVPDYDWRYMFPATFALLKKLTGTDVLKERHVYSVVFGLKLDTVKAQNFIKEYYKMVELGTPFLSCYPEEYVFASILGQSYYRNWHPELCPHLFYPLEGKETTDQIKKIRKEGYYFLLRKH